MFGDVHRALDAEEWILDDLRSVLRHDASGINTEDGEGNDPLWRVLRDKKCSADIVQLLIDYGAIVSNREYLLPDYTYGNDCIHNDCNYGNDCKADVLKVLIKAGACTSHDSISTLCFAFQYDFDDDIVKVLLDAGLLNKCTHHSFLPLICATEDIVNPVRITVFRLLLEAGAQPNVHSIHDGGTPLHKVLCNHIYDPEDMLAIIELLIESGARINAVDNSGNTPLHKTITFYETLPSVVECLLKKGSSVDMRNEDGQTPLEVAVRYQSHQGIIELLFSAGSTLGVKRHSALKDAIEVHVWESFMEDRLKTFFKYYLLEDDSTLCEVDGLIAGHEHYEVLLRFTRECARELKKMETVRVGNGRYSLLEFVRIFIRQQVINFNRNIIDCGIHLMKILEDHAFPLYFETILFKVQWFFERKALEEHLLYVEFNIFCMGRQIILNYDSVRHVAKFLSKKDLLNFIYAFYNNDCLMQDIEYN